MPPEKESLFVRDEDDEDNTNLISELNKPQQNYQTIHGNNNESSSKQNEEYAQNKKITYTYYDSEDEGLYPIIEQEDDQDITQNPKKNIDIYGIRPVDVQLSLNLPFQQSIVQDMLVAEDPLLILGKGLGLELIVANLLYILSTPTLIKGIEKQSLVLLLGTTPEDNIKISEELFEMSCVSDDQAVRNFHIVSAESSSVDKRRKLYLQGGIISITSRILIVDFLSGVINRESITGLFILHVEKFNKFSNVGFITEMYREVNKWGFIKAVSDSPVSFITKGFQPLHQKLKELRLKTPILWPRFHLDVSSSLNTDKSKVIEIKVALTNSMSQIQFGLLECLKKCLDELNRKTSDLQMQDYWCLDSALDENFMRSLHSILDPQWHRISFEAKQLVKDIATLRKLLENLLIYDPVDFFEMINLIMEANKPSITRKYMESLWLMADESQLVVSYAKKRVYSNNIYELEHLPKWEQLLSLLDDINHAELEVNSNNDASSTAMNGSTLIMCSNGYTCNQLRKIISLQKQERIRKYMMEKLQLYINSKDDAISKKVLDDVKEKTEQASTIAIATEHNENGTSNDNNLDLSTTFTRGAIYDNNHAQSSKRRRTRGSSYVATVKKLKNASNGEDINNSMSIEEIQDEITKIDDFLNNDENEEEKGEDNIFSSENSVQEIGTKTMQNTKIQKEYEVWETRRINTKYIDKQDQIIIEKYFNVNCDALLNELRPANIIFYEPNLTFIRIAELYRALNPAVQIYFMYYRDSYEEQRHLNEIKKEKEAFTKLIKERVSLAKHFETEEDLSKFKNLAKRKVQLSSKRSTRVAGGQQQQQLLNSEEMVVVVDIREFNAPLPGLLYRYGFTVIPCMLTVGDYILTPQICVERKSIQDLIGSFRNGRLVEQCKKMSKYYELPTLLIEFSDNQSFSLEPFSESRRNKNNNSHPISSKLMQDEIQMQLAKIVIKFPNLRIIWSSSPLQTVNIILDLKNGRAQPDPATSVSVGKKKSVRELHNVTSDSKLTNKGTPDEEVSVTKINSAASNSDNNLKYILDIPGVSNIDYFRLLTNVKNNQEMANLTLQELCDILGDVELSERIYNTIQTSNKEKIGE
ncbi:related to DNA repair protein RAD1 [Saccharomycodes ludwigii]|uniref:Related to DNA repair protein RAD1 n=1 Tax=Saccharomycodes ludwigii TaxID=36035 RepID=A0A376B4J6_9ASCO|nr:related to DNA repair protein RAD1 [Saccharomycodes ludwigii]